MKIFCNFAKIVAALAAVAGIAYVCITYGDKIVAWMKKTFGKLCDKCCCEDTCCCDSTCCDAEPEDPAPAEENAPAGEQDFEA